MDLRRAGRCVLTTSHTLERASTRQLLTYPASTDVNLATEPVPDLAAELPNPAERWHQRRRHDLHSPSATGCEVEYFSGREVTSEDVVLGLKRLCADIVVG